MVKATGASRAPSGIGAGSDDHEKVQEILNSATWHERLEEARKRREKVLAETAREAPGEAAETPARPWEKPASGLSTMIQVLRETEKGSADILEPLFVTGKGAPSEPGAPRRARPAPHAPVDGGATARRAAGVFPDLAPAGPAGKPGSGGDPAPDGAAARPPNATGSALVVLPGGSREVATVPPAAMPALAEPQGRSRAGLIIGAFGVGLVFGLGATVFGPRLFDLPDGATATAALPPAMPAPAPAPALQQGVPLPATAGPALPVAETTAGDAPPSVLRVTDLAAPASPGRLQAVTAADDPAALIEGHAPGRPVVSTQVAGLAPPAAVALGTELPAPPAALFKPMGQGRLAATGEAEGLPLPVSYAPAAPVAAGGEDGLALDGLLISVFAPGDLAEGEVADISAALVEAGYSFEPAHRVAMTIRQTNVRYYHPEDAAAARAVAEDVEGIARDFTGSRADPPVGTIEVWLAGSSRAKTVRAAKVRKSAAPAPATPRAVAPAVIDTIPSVDVRKIILRKQLIQKLKRQTN